MYRPRRWQPTGNPSAPDQRPAVKRSHRIARPRSSGATGTTRVRPGASGHDETRTLMPAAGRGLTDAFVPERQAREPMVPGRLNGSGAAPGHSWSWRRRARGMGRGQKVRDSGRASRAPRPVGRVVWPGSPLTCAHCGLGSRAGPTASVGGHRPLSHLWACSQPPGRSENSATSPARMVHGTRPAGW
jgi:hypothetical protein